MPNIKHSFASAKSDGGDSTLVKPSDWNAEHTLDSYLDFPEQTTEPSAPAAGSLRVYSYDYANRDMIAVKGEFGWAYKLQPALFSNQVGVWMPASGAVVTSWNLPVSGTGTVSTPAPTLSNLQTQSRRILVTSASTASSGAGLRTNAAVCYGGGAAVSTGSPGGYFLATVVGTPTVLASSTAAFVGLRNTTSVIAAGTQTSALTTIVGFGFDRAATVWSVYSNDSSGTAASLPLTGFDVSASAWHRFALYCPPANAGSAIYWRAENLHTGALSSGSLSADIPNAASLLSLHAHISQNGAGSVAIAFRSMYLETDY